MGVGGVFVIVVPRGSATVPYFIHSLLTACFLQSFPWSQRNPCLSLAGLITLGLLVWLVLLALLTLLSCNGDARFFSNMTAVSLAAVDAICASFRWMFMYL
jgi:hypothetical protein